MQFTSSENEIKDAIKVLDKLVNANTSNTMEAIRRYKNGQSLDIFTSFKLKKELTRVNKPI
ncbi:MAG: hypothetical protein WCF95_01330 [bacterium]